MGNAKRIIEDEQRKRREEARKADEEYKASKGYQDSKENVLKVQRLCSYAPSVLKEFAKEAKCEFQYRGTKSPWGACYACYLHYRFVPSFWGHKKESTHEVVIGVRRDYGDFVSAVLIVNCHDYGREESVDEITEEWFMRILAKQYAK